MMSREQELRRSSPSHHNSLSPAMTTLHSPSIPTAKQSIVLAIPSLSNQANDNVAPDVLQHSQKELITIRRELAIVRQLHSSFLASTQETFASLRDKAQTVKQIGNTSTGQARAHINAGKAALDARTSETLTRLETAGDLLDDIKKDFTEKRIKPRAHVLQKLKTDLDQLDSDLKEIKEQMTINKPAWKRTWEVELQNIVDEQQFVKHQESLINDLNDDLKDSLTSWTHLQAALELAPMTRSKASFRPPMISATNAVPSETVMLEIRSQTSDTERRMKAIKAAEEKKAAVETNPLSEAVKTFGGPQSLRKTGGPEEIERLRQFKSDRAIKAIFTASRPSTPGSVVASPAHDIHSSPNSPVSSTARPQDAVTPSAESKESPFLARSPPDDDTKIADDSLAAYF